MKVLDFLDANDKNVLSTCILSELARYYDTMSINVDKIDDFENETTETTVSILDGTSILLKYKDKDIIRINLSDNTNKNSGFYSVSLKAHRFYIN